MNPFDHRDSSLSSDDSKQAWHFDSCCPVVFLLEPTFKDKRQSSALCVPERAIISAAKGHTQAVGHECFFEVSILHPLNLGTQHLNKPIYKTKSVTFWS